ncbi:MAG TPA: ATP-binding protein [Thermoanaerobaculia bacterium]|nr:ATP-binding protein [Thermoanaerobaculia bacterium]
MITAVIALTVLVVGGWFAIQRIRTLESQLETDERERGMLVSQLEALHWQRIAHLQMLDGLGEGVLALSSDRRIIIANRRFMELFSIHENVLGKPLSEALRMSRIFEAFDRALDGEESIEHFSVLSGIVEKKIEMRTLPVASEGIAAAALFIDITKTERLEKIRRNFISDFSHEVRTPLAGLRSAVETFDANAGRLSVEDEQQLRRIMSRQLRRLERLVEDLSELSRIEAGDVALEFRSIDLRRMLDDLCEDFADQAANHRIRFAVEGNSVICGDVLRLQQAFSNLLDNAIKYGGDDSQVDVAVIDEPEAGVVRIADHGDGIPESERSKIFRRFYRIDKSRSQDIPGSGLGLAITKHLVLQHGGTIDVESEPGKGATFIVRLPKRISNPALPAEASR